VERYRSVAAWRTTNAREGHLSAHADVRVMRTPPSECGEVKIAEDVSPCSETGAGPAPNPQARAVQIHPRRPRGRYFRDRGRAPLRPSACGGETFTSPRPATALAGARATMAAGHLSLCPERAHPDGPAHAPNVGAARNAQSQISQENGRRFRITANKTLIIAK